MYSTLVHFEIPARDAKTLAKFYEQLFGWRIWPSKRFPGYWNIETAPLGKGINGCLCGRRPPDGRPLLFFAVPSLEESLHRCAEAGGRVLRPKELIEGVGYEGEIVDPEGNTLAVLEIDPRAWTPGMTLAGD